MSLKSDWVLPGVSDINLLCFKYTILTLWGCLLVRIAHKLVRLFLLVDWEFTKKLEAIPHCKNRGRC